MHVDERTLAAPQPPSQVPPDLAPPPGPPPAPLAPPRSPLGGVAVSMVAIGLGILGLMDLAGVSVEASAYLAVPLTIVGLGLVLGAWYGHARWLIAVGAVLAVALGIATVSHGFRGAGSNVTWQPTSVEELQSTYTQGVGNVVVDLSAIDFTGRSVSVEVRLGTGNLTVIVPRTVDVTAEVGVDVGNATVFETRWGGIGSSTRSVVDNGPDGVGGGDLALTATLDVGDLEVRR